MFKNADEILEAMTRIWGTDVVSKARTFACDRELVSYEESKSLFPMQISQLMASKGWTERSFVRSLY